MTYNYRTKGVCSKEMHIELNDDHTIKSVEVIGGIRCGFKNTSCPDQLAIALGEALAQDKQ